MELKQVIVIRTDLGMGKGKIAAQSAHASVLALDKTRKEAPEWASEWEQQGSAKVVLKVKNKEALVTLFEEMKKKLPCALIRDAGHTQVTPGTVTCFACGPAPDATIDKYTSELKLL